MSVEVGSPKMLDLDAPFEADNGVNTELVPDTGTDAEPGTGTSPEAGTAPDAGHSPGTGEAINTRTLSRSLFLRLAELPDDCPERGYVRDTLIELNLPLVGTPRPASAAATSRR